MVNYDIFNWVVFERIVMMLYFCFVMVEMYMVYYYIMCIYLKRFFGNIYFVIWSCLFCNSDIWSLDDNGRF